ncbi:MAG: cellulase family glycosylhydrolase [Prevotella sp.]|jgi:hypothetical protein
MKIKHILFLALMFLAPLAVMAQNGNWGKERAIKWQQNNPWFCGVNYIPSNAINYTAMWDKTSFSPKLIDKELQLMQDLGMNCVRVVLQYAVYADDPSYFITTLYKFLGICDKHHIKVMPIFFDDCAFGANTDPVVGKQPEPLPGWYAWAWSPSPGYSMVVDERTHGKLEKYVKDVMGHFKDDPRIFVWDLYNEPTNTTMPKRSWPLLRKVFVWARTVNPSQPITSGMWNGNKELEDFLSSHSDIITFHCYANKAETEKAIKKFTAMGRPVICTEWMNRVVHSTIPDILPMLKENNAGSIMWGLVNGKTQTHLCWGHRPEQLPYKGVWQHDIYKSDFTPYDPNEISLIKDITQ